MAEPYGDDGAASECVACAWEQARSLDEAAMLIDRWLRYELPETPGYAAPPDPETALINGSLRTLAWCGVLTVNSQPGMLGSRLRTNAWRQRASLDLIGDPEMVESIADGLRRADLNFSVETWATLWEAQRELPRDHVVTRAWSPAIKRTYVSGKGEARSVELPARWVDCTWARAGWGIPDVLARLTDGSSWSLHADLRDALTGSRSLVARDMVWGRRGLLHQTAADAAISFSAERITG